MVFVDDRPRRRPFLHRLDRNGRPMLVTATDEGDIALLCPQVPDIDVRRQVGPGQMSDMFQSIGVRKCRGDQPSFWLLRRHKYRFAGRLQRPYGLQSYAFPPSLLQLEFYRGILLIISGKEEGVCLSM